MLQDTIETELYKELANRIAGNVLESPRRPYVTSGGIGNETHLVHLERQLQAELSKRIDTNDWINRKELSTHILSRTTQDMETFDRALNIELGKRLQTPITNPERLVPKTPRPQRKEYTQAEIVHHEINTKVIYKHEADNRSLRKKEVTWDTNLHWSRSWWLWLIVLSIIVVIIALVLQTFRELGGDTDENGLYTIHEDNGFRSENYETDTFDRQKWDNQENTKFKGNIFCSKLDLVILLLTMCKSFLRVLKGSIKFARVLEKRAQDVATSHIENEFKDIKSPSTHTKNAYKRVVLGNTERRHRKYFTNIIYQNSSDKQIRKTRHAHSYIITCPTRICPPPKEVRRSTRSIKNHLLNIPF